jgi:seryl-tRNA synthetase
MNSTIYTIQNGLGKFNSEAIRIMFKLDQAFLHIAKEVEAEEIIYPPLMKVEDLSQIDYFINFPHLGLVTSQLNEQFCSCHTSETKPTSIKQISSGDLTNGNYMLPSAACYNIYLDIKDTVLEKTKYVTTIARCFRNEDQFNYLRRLWSFTMREIVCIGSMEEVQKHLSYYKNVILQLSNKLDMNLNVELATDPFFDKNGAKALMQKLHPVKEEFVYDERVSVASVNFHRNFFGERCNIKLVDDSFAFTGCVAFGIERWLHALLQTYQNDIDVIERKLSDVCN